MKKHPLLLLIALGFMWGSSFALARYTITHGVPPTVYTFWHIIGPIVVLWIINFRKPGFLSPLKQHYKFFLVIAAAGIAIPDLNKFFLAQYIPSGSLGVIINTMPLFIYPLAMLAGEERFAWSRFSGVAIGVAGILLLIMHGNLQQYGQMNWHTAQALLSPLLYAACSVYIVRKRPPDCSAATLCFGMLLYAALLLLPVALITHAKLYETFSLRIDIAILLEIALTTGGYLLLFEILRRAGSVWYSLTDGVVALTSLLWGTLIFAEKVGWFTGCGTALILLGIVLVVRKSAAVHH